MLEEAVPAARREAGGAGRGRRCGSSTSSPRSRSASRPACRSSTACSAAASCPPRSCSSAASPASASRRLLLTALGAISRERRALLVTGEESVAQVKLRAARLGGCDAVEILAETELDVVCETLERERPAVCVIDSVQTLWSPEIGSAPGSVSQVREAAARLLRVAKESGVATFLVGHVTKDGSVAGPRVLEHLVDCVLQFEGDRYHAHRILRAVKNRFGSTNELGVFEMTGDRARRRPRSVGALRPHARRRGRRRGHLRARGHAAAPARDPVARRADRPRDAAAGRHRRRPEAARDDRRRARAPRRPAARRRRRLRQRRRRRPHRRARRRPRDRARDRLGGQGRSGARTASPPSARSASPGGSGAATQTDRRAEECRKFGISAVVGPGGRRRSGRRSGPRSADFAD